MKKILSFFGGLKFNGDTVLCVAKTLIPQRVGRATLYSNESRDDGLSIEYRVYGVI